MAALSLQPGSCASRPRFGSVSSLQKLFSLRPAAGSQWRAAPEESQSKRRRSEVANSKCWFGFPRRVRLRGDAGFSGGVQRFGLIGGTFAGVAGEFCFWGLQGLLGQSFIVNQLIYYLCMHRAVFEFGGATLARLQQLKQLWAFNPSSIPKRVIPSIQRLTNFSPSIAYIFLINLLNTIHRPLQFPYLSSAT